MNFRTFSDLNRCIVTNLHRVPRNVQLVVGVPRSGLLAANLLALHLNLPLADLDGFLAGRMFESGHWRRSPNQPRSIAEMQTVLVVDDSIRSGTTLGAAREQVGQAHLPQRVLYGAIYATPEAIKKVDLYFEICCLPRMFEWNVMHHEDLKYACIDIDGVLCRDPAEEENDDGARYLQFLENAAPLIIPTQPVGFVVTCRLEKYRSETERWLQRYGVKYGELVMMDSPDRRARLASGAHGAFKAAVYRDTGALLFIESDRGQAVEIAAKARKPVFCVAHQEFIVPSCYPAVQRLNRLAGRLPPPVQTAVGRAVAHVRRIVRRVTAYPGR